MPVYWDEEFSTSIASSILAFFLVQFLLFLLPRSCVESFPSTYTLLREKSAYSVMLPDLYSVEANDI